ncbi:MAG: hypothetical protein IT380_12545 [Myxococcales bacterium]|nr:hypothetical protein [Myxococcales bacterium]
MFKLNWLVAGFAAGVLVAAAPSCGGTPKCNASTCQQGCCDAAGKCQTPSNGACGQLGNLCQVCAIGQFCNLGVCSGGSGGGTGTGGGTGGGATGGGMGGGATGGGTGGGATGGGTGGGGTGGGTGGGATGGGTGGGATGGGTGGGATGGGGGTGCNGCYAGTVCVMPPNNGTDSFCGNNGGPCAQCNVATGESCQNFQCVGGAGGGSGGGTGGGFGGGTGGGTGGGFGGGTGGGFGGGTGGGTGGGGGTASNIGAPCTSSPQCGAGLTCKMTTSRGDAVYAGGFCTKTCAATADCGAGANCVGGMTSSLPYFGEADALCVPQCATPGSQSTCRTGYTCYGSAAPGSCWLDPFPPFNGGGQATKTGQPCTANSACINPPSSDFGFCFPPNLSDGGVSGWNQGYCSADCSLDNTGTFCGSTATCVNIGDSTDPFLACMATCATPGGRSTCRAGYTCYGLTNVSICYPDCTATGCDTGETCNTTTGHCQ